LNNLIITGDGSHTIYIKELDEHYHSVHGAIGESEFIFLKNGFDFSTADPLNILEIGFGTGLNALLTSLRAIIGSRMVNYTSLEKYPLERKIVRSLNYPVLIGEEAKKIFDLIHDSPWNERTPVCRNFSLLKVTADFTTEPLSGNYDLVYFDAFGPEKQPEMWTEMMFRKISGVIKPGGLFVTYSVKGEVKRNLRACGFTVKLLPGPPGKRQILRAVKN
jgi:tRNA U34 5-methylaminomethyl-2-thiouridine-forming methyltransferase MnmC